MGGIPATLTGLAVPVDILTPYGRNPRRGDVDAIAASLEVHGQYRPIVARSGTNEVLAGNHTLAAAKQLGWLQIAVTFVDCDDDEAARIVLVDNRTNDLASFDNARLLELLQDLPDLVGTGYDVDALDALLASVPTVPLTDPDDIPPLPEQPFSRLGQVWQLGRHRLMCGDSTSSEHVAALMDGKRANLMATDPPYLVDYDGTNHPPSKQNKGKGNKHWDEYREGAESLFDEFLRVAFEVAVVEAAPVYQWHADMRRQLVVAAWEANDLHPHQTVTWVKSRAILTRSDFMWQHEPCLYGWRKGFRPPKDRRPPANATTVWELDQKARNDIHPTEKPVEVFARPLRWHLLPGEVEFEPFCGSGSAIIAAEMEARCCFAMELEPAYVDAAARRWQEFTGNQPVDLATGEHHDFKQETG